MSRSRSYGLPIENQVPPYTFAWFRNRGDSFSFCTAKPFPTEVSYSQCRGLPLYDQTWSDDVLTDVSTPIAASTTFTSQTLAADCVPVDKILQCSGWTWNNRSTSKSVFNPTRAFVAVCFASLRVVPTMSQSASSAAWSVSNKFSFKTLLDFLMKYCL